MSNQVGLRYQNRQLNLDPDFSIDWSILDDPLDFDSIGQATSWSIELPVKGNEWAFGFASDPSNRQNRFKLYDGFQVTVNNNVWWECTFELLEATRNNKYVGTLSTINSDIFQSKDVSIRELLATEQWTFPAGIMGNVIDDFNGAENLGIRFPYVHFYNHMNRLDHVNPARRSYLHNFDSFVGYACPFFHINHILELLCKRFGLEVRYNILQLEDFKNKLIFTPQQFYVDNSAQTFSYGDFLPDISLAEFLLECSFYSGGKVSINTNDKYLALTSYDYQKQSAAVDLSDRIGTKVVPSTRRKRDILVTYSLGDDKLLGENERELKGDYLGVFASRDALQIAGGNKDDYGYCRFENLYYKFVEANDNLYLEEYSHPFLSRDTGGLENVQVFESLFTPCIRDRHVYSEMEVTSRLVLRNFSGTDYSAIYDFENIDLLQDFVGSGISTSVAILEFEALERKVNIQELAGSNKWLKRQVPRLQAQIDERYPPRVLTANEAGYYVGLKKPAFYNVFDESMISATASNNFIAIFLPFIVEGKVKKILIRRQYDFFFPVCGKAVSTFSNGSTSSEDNNPDLTGSIVTWHGQQQNFGKTDTYPYASSDNYYFNTIDDFNYLDKMSLNTHEGNHNIWDRIYLPLFQFTSLTKVLSMESYAGVPALRDLLQRIKRGKYYKGQFLFRSFSATLSKDGITNQEIEGYSE